MSLFAFEHVTKCYPDGRRLHTVLEDVSFEIDVGDFVGLWGVRRSGKSTLLRIAAGLESPDEGRILFDGQDLTGLSGDGRAELLRAHGIGFVTSGWRPSVSQEVIEYVAVALLPDALSLRQARHVAREQLERMGVLNCAHMLTDRLSIGEAVRVGLAQALVRQPRLLLVDEPAVLPSPTERHELYRLLTSLGRSSALAVVVASEDVGIVRRARRKMTIGAGTLRSMDKEGEVVSFPRGRVSDGRSS
jgi:predicted ABC-type transport system involved in lysophospholipase L1 biosynthesis ATPase subunit